MRRDPDVFYVHEKYARRMASRRFRSGIVLGMLIMLTTPLFKGACDTIKRTLDKHRIYQGYVYRKECLEPNVASAFDNWCETCKDARKGTNEYPCNICSINRDNFNVAPTRYSPNETK